MELPLNSKILVNRIGSKKKPILPKRRPDTEGREIDSISLVS